jgi:hypothetical protein
MSGGITPETLVANLLGPGISFSNVDYTGVINAAGIFTNGVSAGLGFDQGIMLSSGSCASAVGPNNSISMSVDNDEPGDNDLDDISGYETFDASVLEFDFVPVTNSISFYFIFGSEEYPEFVGSQFNDVFAFFLNDVNIALVPGGVYPITINSVNADSNSAYYISNDSAQHDIQADGYLVKMLLEGQVVANETNHIKFAIADAEDHIYDSWVFLEAGSFSTNNPPVADLLPEYPLVTGIGDTVEHTLEFHSPESGQITNITVNAGSLSGFSHNTIAGNTASVTLQLIGNQNNTGVHEILVTATDNGIPQAATTVNLMIRVIPSDLVLQDIVFNQVDSCFDATDTISVAGNNTAFIVNDGARVSLIAGSRILMFPGTKVNAGGDLIASISKQNIYCGPGAFLPQITSGVEEPASFIQDEKSFNVYPNPSRGIFMVSYPETGRDQLVTSEVFDQLGNQVIHTAVQREGSMTINLTGQPNGIYFLRMNAGKETGTLKLFIQD